MRRVSANHYMSQRFVYIIHYTFADYAMYKIFMTLNRGVIDQQPPFHLLIHNKNIDKLSV